MPQVTMIRRPNEPAGRQTILLDGRQIGYYREQTGQVQFAPSHVSPETAEFVKSEIANAGKAVNSSTNPPPAPPEWAEEDDE